MLTCAIGSASCPPPSCPSACGSKLESSLPWSTFLPSPGHEQPWPSCFTWWKVQPPGEGKPGLSGLSNHRPLKECSTNKIYIFCHCWAKYFFRKVQKAVWEPEFEIILCCFFCNPYTDISRTILGCPIMSIILAASDSNLAFQSFWLPYLGKRVTRVTEDRRTFPPCWHDGAYFQSSDSLDIN